MSTSRTKIRTYLQRAAAIFLSLALVIGVAPQAVPQGVFAAENPCEMVLSSTTDNNRYLTTAGSNAFNVVMYNSTYSGVFGDQHMSGIELILHGYRIATNGDLHYLPTPEQWDATPAPSRGTKQFNNAANTITVPMSLSPGSPEPQLQYSLVGAPHPDGGVTLSVVLRTDVSPNLTGKARFNLEFIPSKYREKSYMVDVDGNGAYDDFGIFPFHPQDDMVVTERPNMPSQVWYVKNWNVDRGESQPVAMAAGRGFQFAPEDDENNISITSSTGEMELFDGRNRAQNGWYVLSEQVRGGKAGDTIISWHILPKVKDGWTREPNVAFSQAGYGIDAEKFAVIELDKYDTSFPTTASLVHLNADGSKDVVYTAEITTPASSANWQRYVYKRFTFTDVKQAGMYAIRYGNQESEVFPIGDNVYDGSWQIALNGFLAVQMDHVEVREADRLWHAASHMEDAEIGSPPSTSYFDGQNVPGSLAPNITSKGMTFGSPIPKYNVGGWFDAGDFDLQLPRNQEVLLDLIRAAQVFDNMGGLDELTVTFDDYKTGGLVEMHKPDGIPDIVQQVAHGAKFLMANYEQLGMYSGTVELRTLRQYTHLGDASTDTDGWIYDAKLGPNEIVERDGVVYSGAVDDRMLMGGGGANTNFFGTHSANMAASAAILHDWYPEQAKQCLDAALALWDSSRGNQAPNFSTEWDTLVQLVLATNAFGMADRFEFFKARAKGLATSANISGTSIGTRYNAAYIKHLMDDEYRNIVDAAGNAYTAANIEQYANYPFGVQFTTGSGWGGSPTIISYGLTQAYIYKLFPNTANAAALKRNILRAANYILGTHPVTNNSWLSGFGTKTHTHPYNSNRADEGFIPGSILPGHITVSPDIVESLDDFSFLWFENESIINYQSKWIAVAMAANMIAGDVETVPLGATKDFANSFMMSVKNAGGQSYLSSQGFDAFLFDNTYDSDNGDLKAAGLELVQAGNRIATNGDVSLLPTQKLWYANSAPVLGSRTVAGNSLNAALAIPAAGSNAALGYSIKAEPEQGGVKVTVKLDSPLPADLQGKAGFNLEFSPGQYTLKSYQADSNGDGSYDKFSIFQLSPSSPMEKVSPARMDGQPQYVKDFYAAGGEYQPLPLATGKKITLAAEDDDNRIRVTSDSGDIKLYDGRNVATNGWYVMRTEFAPGQTEIVWHISSGLNPGWTREPNVAHNQAGYNPDLAKVAVIELDPAYSAPATAYVDRLNPDGSFTEVFAGQLGAAASWKRYSYRSFDFTAVSEPGMYAIRYAGKRTELFPIKEGVFDKIWQATLSGFLPIQMDHMTVREGYKIWTQNAHMDDALQAPTGLKLYEDWAMGSETDSKFAALQHINGLNTGGWFDSGNFNIKTEDNLGVMQDLAMAYSEFGIDYDTTYIDWDAKFTELHRNDQTPDIVQQAKQGALQILGQADSVGYVFPGLAVPTLWQHIASGDGSRLTDRRVYDAGMGPNDIYGLRSGRYDDRLAFAGKKDPELQVKAAASLAAASAALKGYDDSLAARSLAAAERMWAESSAAAGVSLNAKWNAAVELLLATGGQTYKSFLAANAAAALAATEQAFGADGWKAVRALDLMDGAFKQTFEASLAAYLAAADAELAKSPFGVPLTDGIFGGNDEIVGFGAKMAMLHKYLPEKVSKGYAFRVVDYILGTHMSNSTSWVSNIGTKSIKLGYGGNRDDDYYIAGGVIRGYSNISSDFVEAVDNYALLRTQNEYTVSTAAKWVALANAVAMFAAPNDYAADFGSEVAAGVANNSDLPLKGNGIAAVYDKSGRMAAYDFAEFDIPAYGSWRHVFSIDLSQYPAAEYDVKVFYWDESFAPLTEPTERDANAPGVVAPPEPPEPPKPPEGTSVSYGSPATIDSGAWAAAKALKVEKDSEGTVFAHGNAYVLWDESNLYVRVDVTDPTIDGSNGSDWLKDSVEVFLSEEAFKGSYSAAQGNQYRLTYAGAFSAKSTGTAAYNAINSTVSRRVARLTDGGYSVYFAIPFSAPVSAGKNVTFDVQINNAAGGNRVGVSTWNDPNGDGYNTSENWGDLTFVR